MFSKILNANGRENDLRILDACCELWIITLMVQLYPDAAPLHLRPTADAV